MSRLRVFLLTVLIGTPASLVLFQASQAAGFMKPPATPAQQIDELQMQWRTLDIKGQKKPLHIHIQANRIRAALCDKGEQQYCVVDVKRRRIAKYLPKPEPKPKPLQFLVSHFPTVGGPLDLDKLAYAVAMAETSGCTAGTGRSKNNCHGIFGYSDGKYGPRTFATTQESFDAFKVLWVSKYGEHFPTLADAQKYTGGEGSHWLNTVSTVYNRQTAAQPASIEKED